MWLLVRQHGVITHMTPSISTPRAWRQVLQLEVAHCCTIHIVTHTMKAIICFLFVTLIKAQRVPKQTTAQCTRELSAFYANHPEVDEPGDGSTSNEAGLLWTQFLLTTTAATNLENDDIVVSVLQDISSDTEKLVALVAYETIIGNVSLEILAQRGSVEPMLTAFTNKSLPLIFARTDSGEYTVTDGARRTFDVVDTEEVACNTRIFVVSGLLLPARTGRQTPRVTASLSEIQDYIDDGTFGELAPAPAPAPGSTAGLAAAAATAP